MADWSLLAVRWILFIDLGLLFGLPLFAVYALQEAERDMLLPLRGLTISLSVLGLAVSAYSWMLMAANMVGGSIASVDQSTIEMLLCETSFGWAFMARIGALMAILAVALFMRRASSVVLAAMILPGAVALASLAWSGHAAAGEGASGWLHLVSDIIHLLAASAWIAALGAFLLIISAKKASAHRDLSAAHRALAGFATVGTTIVTLIVASGLVNSVILIGVENVGALGRSLYGQLMLIKLVLFSGMLLLAADNRFRLTPAFKLALAHEETTGAPTLLRRSLWLEAGAGIVVLAFVAWLGTLAPPLSTG